MPPRRAATLVLVGLLALVCVALPTVFVDGGFRHVVDSAIYVSTAQSLAAGEGYTLQGEPFFLRPPGMSWLLAPWVQVPFDAEDVLPLNLVVQIAAALAVLAVALAMRRLHGSLHGLMVALLFALGPTTALGFDRILSEFPYTALLYFGAWLLLPTTPRGAGPGWMRGLLGALCVGGAIWFRGTGMLMLPAIVLAAWLRPRADAPGEGAAGGPGAAGSSRGPEVLRALVVGAVIVAVTLPWSLTERRLKAEAVAPATQRVAFDLPTALLRVDARDPSSPRLDAEAWRRRVADASVDLANALSYAVLGGGRQWARIQQEEARERNPEAFETDPFDVTVALVVALCLASTALRRRSLLDLYALASLALLLCWFTFVQRLLLPVVPLLLSALVEHAALAGRWVAARLGRPGWEDGLPGALVAVLLGFALVNLPDALETGERRGDKVLIERDLAAWVLEHTAEDDVLLYERAPIMALLTGRRTYTWRHLPEPWPAGCPPVDWGFCGPRKRDDGIRAAMEARALDRAVLPLGPDDKPRAISVFRLGGG